MKQQINKLIKEYQSKIDICDKQLENINNEKVFYRRNGTEELESKFEQLSRELLKVTTQRQAYVQAKVDIASLLDYVVED